LGHFDVLLQIRVLRSLFPQAFEKITKSNLVYDDDAYTFIQAKQCHLHLCAKNTYIMNTSIGHKEAKMEQIHLHKVLECLQQTKHTPYSFVMGCYSSYTSKGTTYENFNSINSIGLFDPNNRDKKYVTDLVEYQQFITLLRTEGRTWTIDPPSRKELYPNMKNDSDYPWSTCKKQLAEKNKELTLLWNFGTTDRNNATVTQWDQITSDDIKMNQHYQRIIMGMINSRLTGQINNLSKGGENLTSHKIEFYLDFEFVNQSHDLSQFPICRPTKYIYMIGCIHVNHETGQATYRNYLINRLNKEQELLMMKQWITEMVIDNGGSKDIHISHWGTSEKTQIESYLRQNMDNSDNSDNSYAGINLHLTDLCELFKTHEVTLPHCFSYNLKDVSKSLYKLGKISTTWTTKVTGDNSITSVLLSEKSCQDGHHSKLCEVPVMQDIIKYNYVDCKVLEEITSLLRSG
jgi:hypothetical protein